MSWSRLGVQGFLFCVGVLVLGAPACNGDGFRDITPDERAAGKNVLIVLLDDVGTDKIGV